MTVSLPSYLNQMSGAAAAHGLKAVSSDFAFEIEGFEHLYLLAKQCPFPILSPKGEIEVPLPLGQNVWQPQQVSTAGQGPISMMETIAGTVDKALLDILVRGGTFHAKVYEGTPEKYLRAKLLKDCFMVLDTPDRDWENRSQVLTFSGTLFYHYYGEELTGNSSNYR